jgi:hypothetical protein
MVSGAEDEEELGGKGGAVGRRQERRVEVRGREVTEGWKWKMVAREQRKKREVRRSLVSPQVHARRRSKPLSLVSFSLALAIVELLRRY